jgi:exopolysaccharide production protein ExoY
MVGWIEQDDLAVLQPYTTGGDARKVADELCAQGALIMPRLTCQVYTYPAHECPGKSTLQPELFPLVPDSRATTDRSMLAAHSASAPTRISHHRHAETTGMPGGAAPEPVPAAWFARPPCAWKRAMDVLLSLSGLILLLPLLLVIAAVIKLVSSGPVLFKQERVGYLGRKFVCLKFRTMHTGSAAVAHESHVRDLIRNGGCWAKLDGSQDKRIIPLGRFLRAAALDELPQLINVLRGDMSLVGPRPCMDYEYDVFLPWQKKRHDAMPGLTGLWQVSGKNDTTFVEMMRLDARYTQVRSVRKDLEIVLRTVRVVLQQIAESLRRQECKRRTLHVKRAIERTRPNEAPLTLRAPVMMPGRNG